MNFFIKHFFSSNPGRGVGAGYLSPPPLPYETLLVIDHNWI